MQASTSLSIPSNVSFGMTSMPFFMPSSVYWRCVPGVQARW